jgi:RasGEF domain
METMRKQQVNDILKWCSNHLSEEAQSLYNSVLKTFTTEMSDQPALGWLTKPVMQSEKRSHLLNLKAKEIAQYLATYDCLYVIHILEKTTLTTLIPQIANDEISIFTTPDLRAEQIQYWVTMGILNSSNMSLRIRWICLFIETCLALVDKGDLFSATLIGNALLSPEIQNLTSTWRKVPPELVASLARLVEICHSCQSWSSHLHFLQSHQSQPWIPYLRIHFLQA